MVQLPLASRPIEQSQSPDILLAGPERDRQIDSICNLIRNLGRAGIPAANYNMNLIGIPRTESEFGRVARAIPPFDGPRPTRRRRPASPACSIPTPTGSASTTCWSAWCRSPRSTRCASPAIRTDPYPPPGYRGVSRVLGTVEGLQRFVTMHESRYHGLNFCQGTIGEMLDDPGREIGEVIRWFGARDKIFNVHFRNIKGRRLDFMEVFPDESDMDMWAALKAYREVGYRYMLMPDHVPEIAGPNGQGVAFAYCYGYIRALLQALEADPSEA